MFLRVRRVEKPTQGFDQQKSIWNPESGQGGRSHAVLTVLSQFTWAPGPPKAYTQLGGVLAPGAGTLAHSDHAFPLRGSAAETPSQQHHSVTISPHPLSSSHIFQKTQISLLRVTKDPGLISNMQSFLRVVIWEWVDIFFHVDNFFKLRLNLYLVSKFRGGIRVSTQTPALHWEKLLTLSSRSFHYAEWREWLSASGVVRIEMMHMKSTAPNIH